MRFVTFLLVLFFISIPIVSFAGIGLGFGGRVVTSIVPPVVCSGGFGPITITPAGTFPATPYATEPATGRFRNYAITPGGYILGLYLPTPAPICWIPVPPPGIPTPVFALPILLYGSSAPSTP